jgi:spermidine/putrescine transport system substrate-binding protein
LTRRDFILRSAALGISLPTLSAILAACGGDQDAAGEVLIGTPSSPVTQPLFDDNPVIASGTAPEAGPLRVYNWSDYINPDTIPVAEEALGVDIEVTTYFNEEEAIQKLISGEVSFDVWFPVAQSIPKVVAGKLIQPLNHDYLPNLVNVWPQLQNPFYDQGSLYSVPYVVYQTGIAWRTDHVDDADVMEVANPWDVFWNDKYRGITGLYDDFRETLYMVMLRNGVADPAVATEAEINAAADGLVELIDLMDIRYTIDGVYSGMPEDRFGLHLAWSGDTVATPFYFPEDADPSVMRYVWPANVGDSVKSSIANDTIAVLRGAQKPVLAHQFLNFMLDENNALENFGWVGYQPPQNGLDVDTLVADEWVPDYLSSAIVLPEDFDNPRAVVPTQLSAAQEALMLDAWSKAQSGG